MSRHCGVECGISIKVINMKYWFQRRFFQRRLFSRRERKAIVCVDNLHKLFCLSNLFFNAFFQIVIWFILIGDDKDLRDIFCAIYSYKVRVIWLDVSHRNANSLIISTDTPRMVTLNLLANIPSANGNYLEMSALINRINYTSPLKFHNAMTSIVSHNIVYNNNHSGNVNKLQNCLRFSSMYENAIICVGCINRHFPLRMNFLPPKIETKTKRLIRKTDGQKNFHRFSCLKTIVCVDYSKLSQLRNLCVVCILDDWACHSAFNGKQYYCDHLNISIDHKHNVCVCLCAPHINSTFSTWCVQ